MIYGSVKRPIISQLKNTRNYSRLRPSVPPIKISLQKFRESIDFTKVITK